MQCQMDDHSSSQSSSIGDFSRTHVVLFSSSLEMCALIFQKLFAVLELLDQVSTFAFNACSFPGPFPIPAKFSFGVYAVLLV